MMLIMHDWKGLCSICITAVQATDTMSQSQPVNCMQAEGAAIAAAVFASVSRAEHDEAATGTQEPGQGLPPDGQADRPKPRARKPKKRTFPGAESEEDALRMKAEAARIAAEVFASVPQVSPNSLRWQQKPTTATHFHVALTECIDDGRFHMRVGHLGCLMGAKRPSYDKQQA